MKESDMKGTRIRSHAISIEHQLRTEFDCERFALGGFIDSEHIIKTGFVSAIILLLSKKYIHTGNRKLIDDFIDNILDYSGIKMDELDEKVVEDILEKFDKIKKKIT